MATHAHEGEHQHRSAFFYLAIALFLAILTGIEIGPLFEWFYLPAAALIALSVVKFFFVVAFFMHLWDDPPIFARLFVAPLIGAALMVIVLMLLHHTFSPAPGTDPFAVQERYRANWNGECSSWLRSSETNRWYCASPAIADARILRDSPFAAAGAAEAGPIVDLAAMSETERKTWLMTRGEEVYGNTCAACHQANGMGVPPAFPPLAGSVDFMGDPQNHARIIVHGLSGRIQVQGVEYNGAMPAQGMLSDQDIAAVATYERNSWGNEGSIVLPEDVRAVR